MTVYMITRCYRPTVDSVNSIPNLSFANGFRRTQYDATRNTCAFSFCYRKAYITKLRASAQLCC